MITRAEAAKLVNAQLDIGTRRPKSAWHYGRVELHELLDAIYGPPDRKCLEEHIKAGN